MNNKETIHMSINEFKENGYKVIDWIADYYENIESYPVLSQAKPGELRTTLPKNPPQDGEKFNNIFHEIDGGQEITKIQLDLKNIIKNGNF